VHFCSLADVAVVKMPRSLFGEFKQLAKSQC